ncbi:MAG TPA: DUF4276 family protein [Bacteroidales bacterium]
MRRIIIICEGPTEQSFCKNVLEPYFFQKGYILQYPLIKHSHGGIVKWDILKKQVHLHLLEKDVFVTTLIDYYGIYPKYGFPRWDEAQQILDKNTRMDFIEQSLSSDILDEYRHRFIPYMQLHEFEGLLFCDKDIFNRTFPKTDIIGKDELDSVFIEFENPELINETKETSPSHRLKRIINGYNKVVYGCILAEEIGIVKMRNKCLRFNHWISLLEHLG